MNAMMIAHVDGGSRGNPGVSGAGVVLEDTVTGALMEIAKPLGVKTNNQAEYWALLIALDTAIALGAREIEVFSDSEVVVKQVNGDYQCKSEELKLLLEAAARYALQFDSFSISHIPREKNVAADRLSNVAMDRDKARKL
jgi:ribonuclease HI